MLDKEQLAEIMERNPKVDPTAVDRSREAAKRLEDAGIQIGDYRLEPPLGGTILGGTQQGGRSSR